MEKSPIKHCPKVSEIAEKSVIEKQLEETQYENSQLQESLSNLHNQNSELQSILTNSKEFVDSIQNQNVSHPSKPSQSL